MTSTHVQAFNSALANARDTAKRARAEIQFLSRNRKAINKVGKYLAFYVEDRDTLHVYTIGSAVYFQLTLRNLESFKCPKLEFLLIDMENNAESARDTRDFAEYLNREYYYKMDGMNICINAFVKSDSPTCRKVVIGTDTVTTPKYQIECD